jgi:hypothetical protein
MFRIIAPDTQDLGGLGGSEQLHLPQRGVCFQTAVFAENISFDRADLIFEQPAIPGRIVLGLITDNTHEYLQGVNSAKVYHSCQYLGIIAPSGA